MLRTTLRKTVRAIGRWGLAPFLRRAWRQAAPALNERPLEYAFAFNCLAKLYPEKVLDVGSGLTSWPHTLRCCGFQVTALDQMDSYWKEGFFNRHFYVINDDITKPRLKGPFDLITCLSTLEHIADHNAALKGLFSLLRPGGHAVLSFPYNDGRYVENVYQLPEAGYGRDYGFICQVFSRKELDGWIKENHAAIVAQEYYEVFSGEFWTMGERLLPPRKVTRNDKQHLACLLLKKES